MNSIGDRQSSEGMTKNKYCLTMKEYQNTSTNKIHNKEHELPTVIRDFLILLVFLVVNLQVLSIVLYF